MILGQIKVGAFSKGIERQPPREERESKEEGRCWEIGQPKAECSLGTTHFPFCLSAFPRDATLMLEPVRLHRTKQNRRALPRYARRWKNERLFAWLFNFRRLVVRDERQAKDFQGFPHLGAARILLRHL